MRVGAPGADPPAGGAGGGGCVPAGSCPEEAGGGWDRAPARPARGSPGNNSRSSGASGLRAPVCTLLTSADPGSGAPRAAPPVASPTPRRPSPRFPPIPPGTVTAPDAASGPPAVILAPEADRGAGEVAAGLGATAPPGASRSPTRGASTPVGDKEEHTLRLS